MLRSEDITKVRRFDELTALKGLFILVIVLHNSMLVTPAVLERVPGMDFIALFGGNLGNSMFFLLSGFGMFYGYRGRIQAHEIPFNAYFGRKLAKLYPMYLISNLASLLLGIIQWGPSAINLQRIIRTSLLGLGGGLPGEGPYNAPTWFLGTLMLCYALFYLLCYHVRTTTGYHCAVALSIVFGCACMTGESALPFCGSGTGTGILNFFLGCALGEALPRLRERGGKWGPPAGVFLLLAIFSLMEGYGIEIICGDVGMSTAFLICPLIVYVAVSGKLVTKVLRWKPFQWLGKISSSVFFWHLVAYYAFLLVMNGREAREVEYGLYLCLMLLWSALAQWLLGKAEARRACPADVK